MLCPATAAAFVPTTAVEEAQQKRYKVLRRKIAGVFDTENHLRPQFLHDAHREKVSEDLHFKIHRVNPYIRGTRRRKEWRRKQITKADLKADIPKQSQLLYFGVIIAHCGRVTMLLVPMIDSRISNLSVSQPGSLAGSLQTTGLPCSPRDPQTYTHTHM